MTRGCCLTHGGCEGLSSKVTVEQRFELSKDRLISEIRVSLAKRIVSAKS